MKVVLVNPQIESYSAIYPPLGLFYIAAVLEKEHQVRIFDPLLNEKDFLDEIVAFQPDVVGLSILTTYAKRAREIIAEIRKRKVQASLVIGGVHPSALPKDSLEYFDADYSVFGEGERTVPALLKAIAGEMDFYEVDGLVFKDGKGEIIQNWPRNLIEDLDSIPYPARHLISFERYLQPPGIIRGFWSTRATTVITSRGCPYKCIWCGSQNVFGRKVRRRSVANVVGEIDGLIRDYKIDCLYFLDDTFTLNKKWVVNFCDALRRKPYKITWACQARVDAVDEELLSAMKACGCVQMDFGVESGSPKVLKALRKDTRPEMVEKAFHLTKRAGIRAMATFMVGNPEETMEDVKMTFDLCRKIKPCFASMYFLTPFPTTELMDMAQKGDWLLDKQYYPTAVTGTPLTSIKNHPVMSIHLTPEELIHIRARFHRMNLFRNYWGLLRSPIFLLKSVGLLLRYPMGILKGLRKLAKTRVLDDFIFEILIHYSDRRKERLLRLEAQDHRR